ncbi:hypothetical protein D3C80_1560680 [compost metagenome]
MRHALILHHGNIHHAHLGIIAERVLLDVAEKILYGCIAQAGYRDRHILGNQLVLVGFFIQVKSAGDRYRVAAFHRGIRRGQVLQ